ncbi:Cu(I)-responsive transcriptional regulator [Pelomonas sp. CA6]|uniref:Cu(I)-responsive transcriptional regulator n=1 Tax=Pelomonas sp. CA6 TaxID=2907999 RepID=UPI001F4C4308|nr:Cu(I)-responsive transcriptional regulator [Pelomonas sp. CA6]MCH7344650.1 Cu(I)-responsive transcriptional regulator [Pelomonas sp. CA6]
MNDSAHYTIGQAAQRSGVSAKMLRHYESLGLLPRVARTDSGYRLYGDKEVHTLRFIRRCRDLGFSMAEIAELVQLWQNRRRQSAQVKRIAQQHIDDLDRRLAEMQAMRRTLQQLVSCCHGDERPDCPILDDLAQQAAPAAGEPHEH